MQARAQGSVSLVALLLSGFIGASQSLALTFDERVDAQRLIDRYYFSHQTDGAGPFDTSIPRSVEERKVRTCLEETVLLEERWGVSITPELLSSELARVVRSSRMPDRLQELFANLGNDPVLISEAIALPILADRWARSLQARDRIPGESFDDWMANASPSLDLQKVRSFPPSRYSVLPSLSTGAAPSNIWSNASLDDGPESRAYHSAVWTGNAMLVWGGESADGWPVNSGFRYDPVLDSWTRTSQIGAPESCIPITVWTGSEMIVWCGRSNAARYNPLTDSWLPVTPVEAPSVVSTAVWTGTEMILWGTSDISGPETKDGGAYDPAKDRWRKISTLNSPSLRSGATATWTGKEVIVFGGTRGGLSYLNDGGSYDPRLDEWRSLTLNGAPSGRTAHTAVWTGRELIVWGGRNSSGPLQTGACFDPGTNSWRATARDHAPQARSGQTAVWTGSRMIVWGGIGLDFDHLTIDLSVGGDYNPVSDRWTIPAPASNAYDPWARFAHSAVWTGREMIVWGGADGVTLYPWQSLNSGLRYSPISRAFTPTSIGSGPPPMGNNSEPISTVWTGNEVILWVGFHSPGTTPQGMRYDPMLDAWHAMSTQGAPNTLVNTAVWTGSRMIVWGGVDGAFQLVNDGARYDPLTDSWSPVTKVNAPSPRWLHTAVWTGSELIVWGGSSIAGGNQTLGDGGRYNPHTDTWSSVTLIGAPSPRSYHTAHWTGSEMLIWGAGPDAGRYDPESDTWTALSVQNSPSTDGTFVSVWTGSEMLVWDYLDPAVGGGRYAPSTDQWTPISSPGIVFPYGGATAVWTGSELIVWGAGKRSPSILFNQGAAFSTSTDSWRPIPVTGAPNPRTFHAAVWTGSAMIVWGGEQGNWASVATGGIFIP